MSELTNRINSKIKEVIELAKKNYNVDLSIVTVKFDLNGKNAGFASSKCGKYVVRLNYDMLQRSPDEIINDTIPHEFAHIVCYMRPSLGSNHDYGWRRVCVKLGGTGERCHENEVVYGKGNTYEYTAKNGKKFRLSETLHNRIQRGENRRIRPSAGGGILDRTCAYVIVGRQGREFSTPIPGKAPAPTQTIVKQLVVTPLQIIRHPDGPAPTPTPKPTNTGGLSKADVAQRIMIEGRQGGDSYDTIISNIMQANNHKKGLAKAYYKHYAAKMGWPA